MYGEGKNLNESLEFKIRDTSGGKVITKGGSDINRKCASFRFINSL